MYGAEHNPDIYSYGLHSYGLHSYADNKLHTSDWVWFNAAAAGPYHYNADRSLSLRRRPSPVIAMQAGPYHYGAGYGIKTQAIFFWIMTLIKA